MKLLPVHLDFAKFTDKDRFPAVHITPTHTEATNGRLLVRASVPITPDESAIPNPLLIPPQSVPLTSTIDASPSGIAIARKDGSIVAVAPITDAPYFPDLAPLIRPESEDTLAIWVDPVYLRDLCAWFAKHGPAYQPSIRLGFVAPDKPITIRATSAEGVEMTALLMPTRAPEGRS